MNCDYLVLWFDTSMHCFRCHSYYAAQLLAGQKNGVIEDLDGNLVEDKRQ